MQQGSVLYNGLAERAMSSFPLSIGTSLAFESLFDPRTARYDPARAIPERIDVKKYQDIWINMYTLFRNLAGAMEKDAFGRCSVNDLRDALLYEMEVIQSLFNTEGGGVCRPIFYTCTYDHLFKSTNKAVVFRMDNTQLQKEHKYKMLESIKGLHRLTDEIKVFDSDIKPGQRTDSLILSHMPWDLLSHKHFHKLDLLESHTGLLRNRYQWYSKFYKIPDENLSVIPFCRKMLLVFGDKVLISPMDRKLRSLILTTAVNRNWTQMTTDEKIMIDLGIDIKEPYVLDVLRHL